jgi:hypothetical protein
VDGAVDSATAEEGGVCGVDDGVDVQFGEVVADVGDFVVESLVGCVCARGCSCQGFGSVESGKRGYLAETE